MNRKTISFEKLRALIIHQRHSFRVVDEKYLTLDGQVAKETWEQLADCFAQAASIEDAVAAVSLHIDVALEQMDRPFRNRTTYIQYIKNLRTFIRNYVPEDIWSGYPLIADTHAA